LVRALITEYIDYCEHLGDYVALMLRERWPVIDHGLDVVGMPVSTADRAVLVALLGVYVLVIGSCFIRRAGTPTPV
jgi:hypothetical protein